MHNEIIEATKEEIKIHALSFRTIDVANRLSISEKELRKHFSSKTILIDCVIEHVMSDYNAKELEILSMDVTETMKISMLLQLYRDSFWHFDRELYNDLKHDYVEQWDWWTNYRKQKVSTLSKIINAAIQKGELAPVNPELITHCMLLLIDGLLESGFLKRHNMSFGDALNSITDVMLKCMKIE